MPVTYRVSNAGQNYETPPYSQHEPHQGYYEPINKSPHQNQNYYGSINRSPHQDQGYYEPVYRGPYQDQGYYGPVNRGSPQNQGYYGPIDMGSHQNQGNYRPINKGPYQDQTYYGPIKRSPYQDQGYNGPTNRMPYYYQDLDYDSDMSDNHLDHGYGGGYVDPYKSPSYGGYVVNNPPQPYMPIPREQSQISDTIEWKETPEAHVYKAYLPGVKRSDVEVEVEEDIGRVLNIKFYKGVEYSGQRVQEVHSIILPDNANTGQVRANMENGVLTVTVLKLPRFMKASRRNI